MKNKINNTTYTDEAILIGERVPDFLPPPEKLVLKKPQTVKISLVLDQMSIDFFKSEAKRLKASYQNMIRNLLQEYVKKMKQNGR